MFLAGQFYPPPARAQEAEPSLAELKEHYQAEITALRAEEAEFLNRLNANYLKSLDQYEAETRRAADLDALLVIREEKIRAKLSEGNAVTPADLLGEPAGLVRLQKLYLDTAGRRTETTRKLVAPIRGRYLDTLRSLQDQLTTSGHLDGAVKVREEIARVSERAAAEAAKPPPPKQDRTARGELPPELKEGLKLHFGFDEDHGDTVVDESGSGNGAEVFGPAKWVSKGKLGGGLSLPGSDAQVTRPYKKYGNSGTVSAWIYPAESMGPSTSLGILGMGRGAFFRVNWARGSKVGGGDTGALDFIITPAKGKYSLCSSGQTKWRARHWYFLTCTWDGSEQRIYVDGALDGQSAQKIPFAGYKFAIGSSSGSSFKGVIDEVMMWDRALSEAEVKALYRATGGEG